MNHKTILVIEDDHETRVVLRQVLEEAGYFVVSAGNGAAGLALLRGMTSPSVILLDIMMPIMSGDEFLKIIREDKERSGIPVLQMSAGSTPQRQGTCGVFYKPLDLRKLLKAIDDCVARVVSVAKPD